MITPRATSQLKFSKFPQFNYPIGAINQRILKSSVYARSFPYSCTFWKRLIICAVAPIKDLCIGTQPRCCHYYTRRGCRHTLDLRRPRLYTCVHRVSPHHVWAVYRHAYAEKIVRFFSLADVRRFSLGASGSPKALALSLPLKVLLICLFSRRDSRGLYSCARNWRCPDEWV